MFRRRIVTWLRRAFVATVLAAVAVVVTLEIIIARTPLPESLDRELAGTPVLLDRNGADVAYFAAADARIHLPVSLEEMGKWLPQATVALEDHRFFRHGGVDHYAYLAAVVRNVRNGRTVSGGSTISQQLIKLVDGRKGRSYASKFREAVLAMKLERRWPKEKILAAYLNRLDYGNRRRGPEAAARAYFGKPCSALTLPEAIYLAGLPQSPSRFNPWKHPKRARSKYERSTNRFALVTGSQVESGSPRILREIPANRAPRFCDTLPDPEMGATRATIDLKLQDSARQFLRSHLAALNRHDVQNAAMVVIENATGAVRVLTSVSVGDDDSEINGALIPRHAGSTLKPFVYLAGIDERRFTAATLLPDTADAVSEIFADYDPNNYNGRFRGPVRVREALAGSLNIPAVVALQRAGPRRTFQQLGEWGLRDEDDSLEDVGAGFVLGNLRVSLIDLANAYACLARGGLFMPPHFLENDIAPSRRVVSAPATAIVEDILCDNRSRALAFGAYSPLHLPGHRTAVKTGTSSSYRDSWTIGYDRDHTVGVWAGNYTGRSMNHVATVKTAAPIWNRMMLDLKGRPLRPLAENDRLTKAPICSLSGLRPVPASSRTTDEWFLPGTEPKDSAAAFFENDSVVLPKEFAGWCRSEFNHLDAVARGKDDGGLEILSPQHGATFTIDRDLPPSQQSLVFKSASAADVLWRVNGDAVSGPWALKPGSWQITAEARDGRRAVSAINVE